MLDVWYVDTDDVSQPVCTGLLPAQETARAERIREAATRRQWLRSRIALRRILADKVGCAPGEIRFEHGPYGKPLLAMPGRRKAPPSFSLARSRGLCVIAVCDRHGVGVDVERLAPLEHLDRLVAQSCSRDEAADLRRLAAEPRLRAFLSIWTRKEAHAKATGTGLQLSLHETAALRGEDGPRPLALLCGGSRAAWHTPPLQPPPGFVASLVARRTAFSAAGAVSQRSYVSGEDRQSSMPAPRAAPPPPQAPPVPQAQPVQRRP